jgi:hypothetical protein
MNDEHMLGIARDMAVGDDALGRDGYAAADGNVRIGVSRLDFDQTHGQVREAFAVERCSGGRRGEQQRCCQCRGDADSRCSHK